MKMKKIISVMICFLIFLFMVKLDINAEEETAVLQSGIIKKLLNDQEEEMIENFIDQHMNESRNHDLWEALK